MAMRWERGFSASIWAGISRTRRGRPAPRPGGPPKRGFAVSIGRPRSRLPCSNYGWNARLCAPPDYDRDMTQSTADLTANPLARSRERGFTLLELLVVIAILGMLVYMVAPAALRSEEHT